MLSDQKLGNYLEVSNRTNQFQIQVVKERGDPLLKMTREPCQMEEKRPVLRRSMFLRKETERPVVETSVIQTRSSEDSKDPNGETNTENVPDSCKTRSCHESERFNVGDETLRDRTVRPVVNHEDSSLEQTMLNEVSMDFQMPGLPHSVVKHAQSTSVRELIQKIENHPDRHALQQDLRQNQACYPFSPESKKNDSGSGQHRIV